jgi:hypothetical protein
MSVRSANLAETKMVASGRKEPGGWQVFGRDRRDSGHGAVLLETEHGGVSDRRKDVAVCAKILMHLAR